MNFSNHASSIPEGCILETVGSYSCFLSFKQKFFGCWHVSKCILQCRFRPSVPQPIKWFSHLIIKGTSSFEVSLESSHRVKHFQRMDILISNYFWIMEVFVLSTNRPLSHPPTPTYLQPPTPPSSFSKATNSPSFALCASMSLYY